MSTTLFMTRVELRRRTPGRVAASQSWVRRAAKAAGVSGLNLKALLLFVATAGRVLRARPAVATAVTRCSGAAMIAIGALLLAEHLLT